MTFPKDLDFDRVMLELLNCVESALEGWRKGVLHTEEPLMNRLIEPFNRRRRGCDVGVTSTMRMISAVALLHRRGPQSTDAFGSDLAVTVDIPSTSFRKTVLIQVKVSDDMVATLERKQIEAAHAHTLTRPRSIVLTADRSRLRTRVKPTQDALALFKPGKDTHQANCASWDSLGQWASKWLSCESGVPSVVSESGGVEGLLQDFVVEAPDDWDKPWGSLDDPSSIPDDWRPARTWLVCRFVPAEKEGNL